MAKKIGLLFISFLLGGVFIFSAIVKLFPVELFEYTFVEIGVSNWNYSPVVARIFIGMECFLGSMLLLGIWAKRKQVLIFAFLLLVFFTFYLTFQILTQGNTGNCGCFGNYIKMTPGESIIKNVIMIFLILILFFSKQKGIWFKKIGIVLAVFLLSSFAMPFVVNPMGYSQFQEIQPNGEQLYVDNYYSKDSIKIPSIDVRKGKHLVAFMSATCPHCRLAGYKLHIFKKNNPSLSIYFFMNGEEENLKDFFEETKAKNIPYSTMTMKQGFVRNAGNSLPAIYLVNNNVVEKRKFYVKLEQKEIEDWFKIKN